MADRFTIDVVSDVICPWCFLGKRRLDAALAALDMDVFIRWRPYMLDPTIPPEGLDRHQYMLNKFGAEKLKTIHDPLIEAGRELDVPYRFDLITRTPNTLDAHRLIRWSHTVERQTEMVERLFMAYWSEGKDVGDRDVLAACAGEAGINAQQIRELLDTEQDVEETRAEIQHATNIGVTGVPTFILAQSYALVGAQSPAVLVDAISRVAKEVGEA
ncbi:disulfide bond formation protein DsbA [Aestuariivirga litoralis]|uniref:Disulfide bond formation protein DsbA n=1 Tax=Aestuariivirga litoralis TaxID=2650924 RepID=A0A2W2BLQ3_9HYPH|nr:DsbA family oxidoreductase [Aestuariivirga litoralis]PZF76767.1 disulfide bond formation protein DsbA [Aestuariivirga litoralis]